MGLDLSAGLSHISAGDSRQTLGKGFHRMRAFPWPRALWVLTSALILSSSMAGCGGEDGSQGGLASDSTASGSEPPPVAAPKVEGCAAYEGPNPSAEDARAAWQEMWEATPTDIRSGNILNTYPFEEAYALVQAGGVQWASNQTCRTVQDARDKGVTDLTVIGVLDWQIGNPRYMMGMAAQTAAFACLHAKNDTGYPSVDPAGYYEIPLGVCPALVPQQYR